MLSRLSCAPRVPALWTAAASASRSSLRTALPRRPMSTTAVPASGLSRGARIAIGSGAAVAIIGLGAYGASMQQQANTYGTSAAYGQSKAQMWSDSVRSRMRQTFSVFGAGLGITALTAAVSLSTLERMAARSPIGSMFLIFGGTMVAMFTTMAVPKENTLLKLSAFTAFNGLMGLSLAPLVTLGGPLVLRAAAYTGAIVGSLAYIAATAPSDDFLWMGGPLTIGLGIVLVSSVGTMIAAPGGAAFTAMNAVALYGGLALFSGFVLYDISKIKTSAELLSDEDFDPVNQSIGLYLDTVNIFVRIATILSGNKKK